MREKEEKRKKEAEDKKLREEMEEKKKLKKKKFLSVKGAKKGGANSRRGSVRRKSIIKKEEKETIQKLEITLQPFEIKYSTKYEEAFENGAIDMFNKDSTFNLNPGIKQYDQKILPACDIWNALVFFCS